MSLRAKLIAVFTLFGVVPIVALGVFTYVRSMQAVEDLVAARTAIIAERATQEIRERYALRQSDLLLLAENAETQRLYRTTVAGEEARIESARHSADEYLRRAWEVFGGSYRRVEFRDSSGFLIYGLGEAGAERALGSDLSLSEWHDVLSVAQPILDIEDGSELGTLIAFIRVRALLPDDALAVVFGREGYSTVLDRSVNRVLFHPSRAVLQQPLATLLGPDGWGVSESALSDGSGNFKYREEDTPHVASFASLETPPWTIVSSASVGEFAPPFARTRFVNLLLVLVVAAVVSVAFLVLTGRLTRSLGALTSAADQVARGDFTPQLPPGSHDEVGRLSSAFALMVQQVRDMLRRVQESRHMAVIGQFASQLSHEIRNPLTSIKLNLQGLDRGVRKGSIPNEYERSIGICLREVNRLDRVAGGVLSIARTRPTVREPCSVHAAIHESLEALRSQFGELAVEVRCELNAATDTVKGDAAQLKGVFLNLFLNSADAMPGGGILEVSSENSESAGQGRQAIRIRVADSGPGIPLDHREKIFDPFFSTKEDGTGFGLALALQAVEEHEGALTLEDTVATASGAVFAVELPLYVEEQTA